MNLDSLKRVVYIIGSVTKDKENNNLEEMNKSCVNKEDFIEVPFTEVSEEIEGRQLIKGDKS
jgi:hypothetical protein